MERGDYFVLQLELFYATLKCPLSDWNLHFMLRRKPQHTKIHGRAQNSVIGLRKQIYISRISPYTKAEVLLRIRVSYGLLKLQRNYLGMMLRKKFN